MVLTREDLKSIIPFRQRLGLECVNSNVVVLRQVGFGVPGGWEDLWTHSFPFWIDGNEPEVWDLSREIMAICVDTMSRASTTAGVVNQLTLVVEYRLVTWAWSNAARARQYGIGKVHWLDLKSSYEHHRLHFGQTLEGFAPMPWELHTEASDDVVEAVHDTFRAFGRAVADDNPGMLRDVVADLSDEALASVVDEVDDFQFHINKKPVDNFQPELNLLIVVLRKALSSRNMTVPPRLTCR